MHFFHEEKDNILENDNTEWKRISNSAKKNVIFSARMVPIGTKNLINILRKINLVVDVDNLKAYKST